MTGDAAAIWAVIPAAGSGTRMQAELPKQYLSLRGRPLILHTLERMCTHERIRGVKLGLAPRDPHWDSLRDKCAHLPRFLGTFVGGAQRAHTVLNGIEAFAHQAQPADWVIVHDAVRPCVRRSDIDKLIDAAIASGDGGLLALPLTDTIKRVDADGRVAQTVARAELWRALTPQMFRVGALRNALRNALARGDEVTDEATAMERAGPRPRVVIGHADNIKITLASDIALAEFILSVQERAP